MANTGAETTGPRYPELVVQLSGTDGNAFALMGVVRKALKVHLRDTCTPEIIRANVELFTREATSGDYDNLLHVCSAWVTVR
jgi:hypothetical protein